MVLSRLALFGAIFAAAIAPAAAERFTASRIQFENVTGDVQITTNAGEEIEVVVRQGKEYHPVQFEMRDGIVYVRGEAWKSDEPYDCCNTRIRRTFDARATREARANPAFDNDLIARFPTIVVTMPRKGDVTFIDARMKLALDSLDGALNLDGCYVYGEAKEAGSAVIGLTAGSQLVMGDVGSGLEVDLSGDANFRSGKAASVDVDIAGPGDVVIGDVDGMLDVSIAGSGSVRGTRLDGPLTARIAGSGLVWIAGGRADGLTATIDGSGGVVFEGAAHQPNLRLYGSSEVRLGSVTGRLTRAGAGDVFVGGDIVSR